MLDACSSKSKFIYIVPDLDSTITVEKISINRLAKDYKRLNDQYIETQGIFFHGFEEFAIYTDQEIFSDERKGFWMETNRSLNITNDGWQQINKWQGNRIIIKGRIDTSSHGHLRQYLATIKNIYFLKEK